MIACRYGEPGRPLECLADADAIIDVACPHEHFYQTAGCRRCVQAARLNSLCHLCYYSAREPHSCPQQVIRVHWLMLNVQEEEKGNGT